MDRNPHGTEHREHGDLERWRDQPNDVGSRQSLPCDAGLRCQIGQIGRMGGIIVRRFLMASLASLASLA